MDTRMAASADRVAGTRSTVSKILGATATLPRSPVACASLKPSSFPTRTFWLAPARTLSVNGRAYARTSLSVVGQHVRQEESSPVCHPLVMAARLLLGLPLSVNKLSLGVPTPPVPGPSSSERFATSGFCE